MGALPDWIERLRPRSSQHRSPTLLRGLVLCLVIVASCSIFLASCGADETEPVPSAMERTVHVSGIACSQPREGVGVDVGGGWILTSGHVTDGIEDITVLRSDGTETQAKVVHVDRVLDVAVLSVGESLPGTVEFADIQAGDKGMVHIRRERPNPIQQQGRTVRFVAIAGEERSVPFTVDRRIRANTEDVGRENTIVRPSTQISASLARGDSGASLWDDEGRIVGVVWAVSNQHERRAFAVQGDELDAVLQRAKSADASGPLAC